ncbi:MAG: nuclear transport factor 2 [Acidimicrobiales bacterium]|jgi:steroid delta-isomerase|nr:nuclear transport factor 2 [Acidimicrobiales bacterium]
MVEPEAIRTAIAEYQRTFSDGDRDGWLALFADDAVLEDPVGSHRAEGKAAVAAFWDAIHQRDTRGTVKPVLAPAVCGQEAAWAFEVHVEVGGVPTVISIIDFGRFDDDGRIAHIRAFWDPTTVRR